jgi:flagellar assembly factor FliW
MKLQTTRFGEIELDENACFEMISPVFGYEDENKFLLIENNTNAKLKWFQSVKTPDLAFVVSFAGFFGIDYSYELPEDIQESLEISEPDDVLTLNIVVIPHGEPEASTINLLAPLVFNVNTRRGAQVVLSHTHYDVDYPLFKQGALC